MKRIGVWRHIPIFQALITEEKSHIMEVAPLLLRGAEAGAGPCVEKFQRRRTAVPRRKTVDACLGDEAISCSARGNGLESGEAAPGG